MSSMFEKVLHETTELIDDKMDKLLPDPGDYGQTRLFEAMRYSVLSSGKRLRPFLTVTTATLFGVSKSSALQVAAAIEFIHAYSLIHDDLPAMDDDDMRRGQPSCHKKFDEATAILAGDALLTMAFEVLSDSGTHSSAAVRCELIRCIAKASGPMGMVGGQMMDLTTNETDLGLNKIIHLQRLKTGELFAISCEAGAILGNAAANLRTVVRAFAHDIGLAFQITDDLLDAVASTKKDKKRAIKSEGKATLVGALGVDKARQQANILATQAIRHLEVFGKRADILRSFAEYVVSRTH